MDLFLDFFNNSSPNSSFDYYDNHSMSFLTNYSTNLSTSNTIQRTTTTSYTTLNYTRSPLEHTTEEGPINETVYSEDGLIPSRQGEYELKHYIVGVSYGIMGILGIVFNIITIYVLQKGKNSSKEVRVQLTNLAIADLLTSVLSPLHSIYGVIRIPYPKSLLFCRLEAFFSYFTLNISPLWNACLSVERLVIVYFPFKIKRYTRRKKKIIAVAVWAIAFLVELEYLTSAEIEDIDGHGAYVCFLNSTLNVIGGKTYPQINTMISALKYSLPSLTIVVMYALIAFKLYCRKRVGESITMKREAKSQKMRRQTLTMLATDAIVTVVTWLPYCGYQIYEYGSDDGHRGIFQRYSLKQNFVPHAAFTGLLLTNCFTTPVIYYMFQSAFRKDTHALVNKILGKMRLAGPNACGFNIGGGQPPKATELSSLDQSSSFELSTKLQHGFGQDKAMKKGHLLQNI